MIRGVYSAASNMLAMLARAQMISNNLANLSTPGYKEDTSISQSSAGLPLSQGERGRVTALGTLGLGVGMTPSILKLDQGPLRQTNNPFDLALEGPGFFAVQTQDGVRYTRAGAFVRDAAGLLATPAGHPLLGVDGPVRVPDGEILVRSDGVVMAGGNPVAQLQLVDFPNAALLRKIGSNLFEPTPDSGDALAADVRVRQGYLEEANVDAAQAMVDLMGALRSYELSQRIAQLQDDVLGRAVTEVGRLS